VEKPDHLDRSSPQKQSEGKKKLWLRKKERGGGRASSTDCRRPALRWMASRGSVKGTRTQGKSRGNKDEGDRQAAQQSLRTEKSRMPQKKGAGDSREEEMRKRKRKMPQIFAAQKSRGGDSIDRWHRRDSPTRGKERKNQSTKELCEGGRAWAGKNSCVPPEMRQPGSKGSVSRGGWGTSRKKVLVEEERNQYVGGREA